MLVLGIVAVIFVIAFIETLLNGLQHEREFSLYDTKNLTIANLLSDSELKSYLLNPSSSNHSLANDRNETVKENGTLSKRVTQGEVTKDVHPKFKNYNTYEIHDKNLNASRAADGWESQQKDEPAKVPEVLEVNFQDSLFEIPKTPVQPDWTTVLGSFDHYDDENWNNFLVKTEVPLLVRLYLSDSSESVDITRLDNNANEIPKGTKDSISKRRISQDIRMQISTSSWMLTHESSFILGKPYIEHDIDGTDSKNTFFFISPRLLVHNKIKDKWRTAIIRHFDETSLNMTFVDRDRMIVARRFFHRVKP